MAKYYNLQQIKTIQCQSYYYELEIIKIKPILEENDILLTLKQNQDQNISEEVGIKYNDLIKGISQQEKHIDRQIQLFAMEQHNFILKKYINKYNKLLSSNDQDKSKNAQKCQKMINFVSQEQKYLYIDSEKITVNSSTAILKQFEGIQEYIKYIDSEFSGKVKFILKQIIILVIETYNQNKIDIMNEQDIINFTHRLVNQDFLNKIFSIISGKTTKKQKITSQLKLFTIFMVNSILFIASQYFINPYYQLQQKLIVRQFQNYKNLLYDSSLYEVQEEQDLIIQNINGRKLKKI